MKDAKEAKMLKKPALLTIVNTGMTGRHGPNVQLLATAEEEHTQENALGENQECEAVLDPVLKPTIAMEMYVHTSLIGPLGEVVLLHVEVESHYDPESVSTETRVQMVAMGH